MKDVTLEATLLGATMVEDTQAILRDAAAQVPVVNCLLQMRTAAVFQPAAAVFPIHSPPEDVSKGLCPQDLPEVSHRLLPLGLLWD
jgi:hypothetical protein